MALLDGGTSSSSLVQVGPTPNGQPPRRAIALRLSEETLAQLMALASRGSQPNKGTLQIDLGSNPGLPMRDVLAPSVPFTSPSLAP
ncbi:BZ3500_MvSof-1268-A1-R1_Chr1-1g01060 [Microbotryum saponariae]|uniref:BZ3500_MvSof-1268-A1-R1_Chr1-1g01060 protein n=1 Tax=Microbotryum saponariae TaxID=289078 RepID=A0A2X0MBS6_9BASI|nr:BZ3500_MvSof-1268-A1-R1_Chr1-1g01060 [Microbotryum saponariae]SCZ93324.1 BZ3501_MvSof-1269-A2-R1_Chr1-1g00657 [Microbotryum saponariae]